MDPIIHIIDDDEPVRSGLVQLFASIGMQAREYDSASRFLETYDAESPGCIIVDVRMPEINGIELLEALGPPNARLPVIVMSGHGDISLAVRAIKCGAMDFLEKPFRQQDLLDRVNEAVARDLQRRRILSERSVSAARFSLLTPREREVMDRLVAGDTAEQIGLRLGLSGKTVYTHRGRILLKLQVDSIAALTRLALSANGSISGDSSPEGPTRMHSPHMGVNPAPTEGQKHS